MTVTCYSYTLLLVNSFDSLESNIEADKRDNKS